MSPGELLRKDSFFFLAKFFGIFAAGELALPLIPLDALEKTIAVAQAGFFDLQAVGNTLTVKDTLFVINEYCTGAVSSLILLALVFSLKKPGIKTKIGMWGIGTLALFGINFGRLYAVLWAGNAFSPQASEIVHILSWFVVSGIIIAVWYVGVKKIARVENFSELI